MFNLFISSGSDSWDSSPYELERNRAVVEYTSDEIRERYKLFNTEIIDELKSFPSLFVAENETVESRIGYIKNIRTRMNSVIIDFEFDPIFPKLKKGAIEELRVDIDLGRLELSRTHWAIKNEPIFDILVNKGFITQQQLDASQNLRAPKPPLLPAKKGITKGFNNSQVFIVHGHDELAKFEMSDFIKSLGLEPIILHEQASTGRTIIEKIEDYSNVGFGVVLYTPCDVGYKVGALTSFYRARQNVVFEHGFLIGKLTRARVVAVVKGDVETPNDISGVVYVPMDIQNQWKIELIKEMQSVGYNV